MSANLVVLQVFIASPSDLQEERRAIKEIADKLNSSFGREVGLQLQLLGWEDRLPGCGRPQAQINEDVDKADLFIGFLWRRWGSDPGNPEYTSGFEEEFHRAMERRTKTGCPEVCLFFKAVDEQSLRDPGDQLKRVLDFRQEVEKSKKILFRDFQTLEQWKEQTRELLERHLLKLLSGHMSMKGQAQPQSPPERNEEEPSKQVAPSQEGQASAVPARRQLLDIWREAAEAIELGELETMSKSKALESFQLARLGLAVASMTNRDIEPELPGVHLTNVLFKNRHRADLTNLECLTLLRSNLVPDGGYKPAWFWVRKSKFKVATLLLYLACHDEHPSVRESALHYARQLNLPLRKARPGKESPLTLLCAHTDPVIRMRALEFLQEKGTKKDLRVVNALKTDVDNDVRVQAELTYNAIMLRYDTETFYENSVLKVPWISEGTLSNLNSYLPKLSNESLAKALAHPDEKVRVFVAKELARRSAITFEQIKHIGLTTGVSEVLSIYYRTKIADGEKFLPEEVRAAMKPEFRLGLFPPFRSDIGEVITEMLERFTYEDLNRLAITETEDAALAYRVLALKHFQRFASTLREDLANRFRRFKDRPEAKNPTGREFWFSFTNQQAPDVRDLASAALTALSQYGTGSDRHLVLPYLDSKTEAVRIAAIKTLGTVGSKGDLPQLLALSGEENINIAEQAAKSALMLDAGPFGAAARHLLLSSHSAVLRHALASLASFHHKEVWPLIEPRLHDPDPVIRKIVCAYAVEHFNSARLTALLDQYVAKQSYFYNVAYWLDRVIYAKTPLKKVFKEEIGAALQSK